MTLNRKIRMGMVGGGQGAFIGAIHRIAAGIDGQIELVCGAFSSDAERALASGKELFLPEARCYSDFETMMSAEAQLPEGERMDFVAIVTPNHVHFPVAKAALEAGFHVLSDKPATLNLAEAKELAQIVARTGLKYGLTHNYTGYPMVQQAREMVQSGQLGKLRKVVVEYPQGWLATPIEQDGQKQATWRTDPKRSGAAGCIGDIGTHAENLAEFITGLQIKELAADLTAFVDGRLLDDDGNILLRFEGGAKGILHASQISAGEENALNIRIYGETGGLEWHQMEPNTLLVKHLDAPTQIYRTGGGYLGESATAHSRTPAGHPEGYLEAFANIYRNFAADIAAELSGAEAPAYAKEYPSIQDGVRGMAFIEAVVQSSQNNAAWTPLSI
ncbi:Gfo/Idh/MocA family oxidoreductase [Coraliomargarita algicola]|uniref:Gfo/Idh/MocA family oxidoreductase n=1 Tax=Coraliomargarita algicola TaxID=3092156 RepID=A0ABZ0RFZ4_9BACT|nr:Gfo/Idh/MocA family oxidoreductase [Coraliomargarita sp. J2-16]WPJ95084.1 Gfo/Idh/MocA family oxidoreductase [Coraliomargarita sp. J2-16]